MDANGIAPLEEKVRVIRDFLQPTSQRQLRQFLGLVNFYHRFLPNCAQILQPLNALLNNSKRRSDSVTWTEATETAFTAMKDALANATLLSHPKPDAETCASDIAVGAVLQQRIDGVWCPLSYFSRALKPAESRYIAFDRELLAVYLAIKHFRYFVHFMYSPTTSR